MAELTSTIGCRNCSHVNEAGRVICDRCDQELSPAVPRASTPMAESVDRQVSASCPACGAPVPDPGNLQCVNCLEPLGMVHGAALVEVRIAGGALTVEEGSALVLGRDPAESPCAALFDAHDNVSRRHATIGMHADGVGWVRDEHATNGTFVNGTRLVAGDEVRLCDDDELRLASNVVGRVLIRRRPRT